MMNPATFAEGNRSEMDEGFTRTSSHSHFKSLSVFAGAGGMDVGLERAGFSPIAYIENDPWAQETLSLNRPHWRLWKDGDIFTAAKSINPADFCLKPGDLDLVSGGPPCQPFSAAAQWAATGRRGMADDRARTIHALLDVIEAFLPRAVLLENVNGFLYGRSSALPDIQARLDSIRQLHGLSYVVHKRVLDAADYGVPQNRKRAIILLLRDDLSWNWPEPTHVQEPITAWDALADLEEEDLPVSRGKWADLLPSIPEGWNYQWLTSRGGGEELFGYRTRYWNFLLKLSKNRPAWTLPATPGPSTGPFHWDNRPLTIRERMRLQGFPDEWLLAGVTRQQIRLVGNATPPPLAEVFGLKLAECLGFSNRIQRPSLLRERTTLEPATQDIQPIPERFRNLIGAKEAHRGTGQGPASQTGYSATLTSELRNVEKPEVPA